jgi:predicted N-acetyltransferase YhbS
VAELSLVARDELNSVAGAIRYWPVRVGGAQALLLGPIAVHPTHQGEGLGAVLMQDSMARARALGWARVLLVGDEPYYGRFGFSKLNDVVMPPPTNPDRVLGHELTEGAWDDIHGDVEKYSVSD